MIFPHNRKFFDFYQKQTLFFFHFFKESGLHSVTCLIKYSWFIRSNHCKYKRRQSTYGKKNEIHGW